MRKDIEKVNRPNFKRLPLEFDDEDVPRVVEYYFDQVKQGNLGTVKKLLRKYPKLAQEQDKVSQPNRSWATLGYTGAQRGRCTRWLNSSSTSSATSKSKTK